MEQAKAIGEKPILSRNELLVGLAAILRPGETPTKALIRLAPETGRRKFDARSKRLVAHRTPQEKAAEEEGRRGIDRITEMCTLLLEAGIGGIVATGVHRILPLITFRYL